MKSHPALAFRLPLFFGAALFGLSAVASGKNLALKYKTYRDWNLVLPKESFSRVSGDFHFGESSPSRFSTKLEGTALRIDKNADGEMDAKVEGDQGLVILKGKTNDGRKFLYSVRLAKGTGGWHYAASGAATGVIDGQKVRFIDQNNNGRYDEYGIDAMVVGQGRYASFLSKVINVRGQLYSIDLSKDGRSLSYEPYEGPQGTVDLGSTLATKGKLLSAVIQNSDGLSFNLNSDPTRLPVGQYQLYRGMIGLGSNVVQFSKGKSQALEVKADETLKVAYGEPLNIDFTYVRQPGRVILAPQLMNYVGQSGELYDQWKPQDSPRFALLDLDSGKGFANAVFGSG
ncbi:MAG: hypothetical protein AAF514_10270 [Verrucomicrobiota bacterium]